MSNSAFEFTDPPPKPPIGKPGRMALEDVETSLSMAIGRNVRGRRISLGLTQAELAAAASINQAAISRVERGDPAISLASLVRLANALKVTPSALASE